MRAILLVSLALAQEAPGGISHLTLSTVEATVGDPIQAILTVDLPAGSRLDPPDLRASLGGWTVSSARWTGPDPAPGGLRWTWNATLTAFETGVLEVPSMEIPFFGSGEARTLRTEPRTITIRSVLSPAEREAEEAGKQPEIGDLKSEVSVPADFGPLKKALAVVVGLLAVSALAWWLQRRYASRLAAVPAPTDPFRRLPPHVWAYQELQRLLEQRLPESGKVDRFFSELSRILKLYLGGRYRVDLMEHTTEELVPLLGQAGAPSSPLLACRGLLERCDLVKFARLLPPLEACRDAVEEAYRIVDVTKPAEETSPQGEPAERGAA